MSVDYDGLPEHMREGARAYVEDGIRPGDCMLCCLENDFIGAYQRADAINADFLGAWVVWVATECPSDRCGDTKTVREWIAKNAARRAS